MGLKFNIIINQPLHLPLPPSPLPSSPPPSSPPRSSLPSLPSPPPSLWFVLFGQKLEEKNREHRRSQSNSTYMSFQAQSLTHNIPILATPASTKVMKIICGVCASIVIMVIGLILVRKRKVLIKRYHRRSSKFVL